MAFSSPGIILTQTSKRGKGQENTNKGFLREPLLGPQESRQLITHHEKITLKSIVIFRDRSYNTVTIPPKLRKEKN
jgi:hypothetical protein